MLHQQIHNYKIISLLGEGGMGTVYLGEHVSIGRKVAIKIIHQHLVKNEAIRERFKNEAAIMSRLQHPNIVLLYDYFAEENGLYLIMEYVDGIDLGSYLQKLNAPLDEDLAKAFMQQLLSAFSHAHENSVIHRDIKPNNILITDNGTIKVLDFGIAKLLNGSDNNLTRTGTQLGTVYYMSPEQVQGKKITRFSDIYSLGVTFYQMLTGINPYQKCVTEYEIYHKIVHEPLPDPRQFNPSISAATVEILQKATNKDPLKRFPTCIDWQEEMNAPPKAETTRAKEQESPKTETTNVPPSLESKASLPKLSNKTWIGVGLVALLVFYFWKSDGNYKYVYVLTDKLNLRSAPDINSDTQNKIEFGQSIAIIGDTIKNNDGKFNYTWVECKYEGKKGWVAFEIDGQKTTGTIEDRKDFISLLNAQPSGKYEYHYLRIEVHHAIIQFLKEKGLNFNYKYFPNTGADGFKTIEKNNEVNGVYEAFIILKPVSKKDNKILIYLSLKKNKNNNIFVGKIKGFELEKDVFFFRVEKVNGYYIDAYNENKQFIRPLKNCFIKEIE